MTNKCYYCGAVKASVEHIPAKSLLNGISGLNLLTVPSCYEHNNGKSNLDELVGLILIKPTITGYRLYTPNPKNTPIRNSITEMRIRNAYWYNLFCSDKFRYKDGIIEVSSPLLLQEILKYFEYMLTGCYYDYTGMSEQLPRTHHCISLSIFHFLDYPPNIFSRLQDTDNYSILSKFIDNSRNVYDKHQNSKFKYEIRRIYPHINLNINLTSGDVLNAYHDDLLIIATLHSNIVIFGVFSTQNKKFISLNKAQSIFEQSTAQLILPYGNRK